VRRRVATTVAPRWLVGHSDEVATRTDVGWDLVTTVGCPLMKAAHSEPPRET
jgi:hypothetical protein